MTSRTGTTKFPSYMKSGSRVNHRRLYDSSKSRLSFHRKDDQGDGPLTLHFNRELPWNRVTTVRNHNTDAHIEIDLADSLLGTWVDLENCC